MHRVTRLYFEVEDRSSSAPVTLWRRSGYSPIDAHVLSKIDRSRGDCAAPAERGRAVKRKLTSASKTLSGSQDPSRAATISTF